jgi:hypothetical protein
MLERMRLPTLLLVAVSLACGGGAPANFAGTYSVTVVDGANNCNLANWTPGNSAGNIPIQITQDNTLAQVTIQGLVGGLLSLEIGTNVFSGTVSGNTFTATHLGTNTQTQQSCMYTVNTTISSTVDANNNLSGTITYTPKTNSDPTCGALQTCVNQQTFTGARTGP